MRTWAFGFGAAHFSVHTEYRQKHCLSSPGTHRDLRRKFHESQDSMVNTVISGSTVSKGTHKRAVEVILGH